MDTNLSKVVALLGNEKANKAKLEFLAEFMGDAWPGLEKQARAEIARVVFAKEKGPELVKRLQPLLETLLSLENQVTDLLPRIKAVEAEVGGALLYDKARNAYDPVPLSDKVSSARWLIARATGEAVKAKPVTIRTDGRGRAPTPTINLNGKVYGHGGADVQSIASDPDFAAWWVYTKGAKAGEAKPTEFIRMSSIISYATEKNIPFTVTEA